MKRNHEMDLTEGKILPKLLLYALPLLATNVLSSLFNVADVTVLGIMVGDDAVAAVGSTGSLVNLIVNLFIGLSVGANVIMARAVGAKNVDRARKTVGTSMYVAVFGGVILAAIGFFGARTFLTWMDCDPEVLDLATLYLKIYFLGMPIILLYNFCASILRAVGDTLRPLIYLIIAGVLNVLLNIGFIYFFDMEVEGVAIATVVSQLVSAILALIAMVRSTGYASLKWSNLKFDPEQFRRIAKIGVPAGLQSAMFSISNVLIQSSVNSFGKAFMTANSIAANCDGLVYNALYAFALTALAFTAQNYGAKKLDRINRSMRTCLLVVTVVGILIGGGVYLLRVPLAGLITKDPTVIEYSMTRFLYVCAPYFLCGWMDTYSQGIRGLGKSTVAMLTSLFGSCVLRVIWLKTIFPTIWHTPECIYIIYPISWILTSIFNGIMFHVLMKRIAREFAERKAAKEKAAAAASAEAANA